MPSGFKVKTPSVIGVVPTCVKVKTPPSTFVTPVAKVPLVGTSSLVDVEVLLAIGASLTALTVMVKVAVSHKPLGSHVL